MAHQVFIGYAAKDRKVAERLCRDVEDKGYSCWIAPRNVEPGQDWSEAIVQAITSSEACLLILSSHANVSRHFLEEASWAREQSISTTVCRIQDVAPGGALAEVLNGMPVVDAFESSGSAALCHVIPGLGLGLVGALACLCVPAGAFAFRTSSAGALFEDIVGKRAKRVMKRIRDLLGSGRRSPRSARDIPTAQETHQDLETGRDVFISYSSRDEFAVSALRLALEGRGWTCWTFRKDILAGTKYFGEVTEAIKASRALLVVFSANADRSKHVTREVHLADRYDKTIVPLRIENAEPTGAMEYLLVDTQWFDAFPPPIENYLNVFAGHLVNVVPKSN